MTVRDHLSQDELAVEAATLIIKKKTASASILGRYLKLGYMRSHRVIQLLEDAKIIGPFHGNKPREILITDIEAFLEKEYKP